MILELSIKFLDDAKIDYKRSKKVDQQSNKDVFKKYLVQYSENMISTFIQITT